MVTTYISSIGSGSGMDYPDIDAWEIDTDHDLKAGGTDSIEIGEMYNDSTFDEIVVLAGNDGDETHYRWLRPAEGEGGDGTRSGAGVTIKPTSNGIVIHLLDDFIRLGMQGRPLLIERDGGANSDEGVRVADSTQAGLGIIIDSCFIWATNAPADSDGIYGGPNDVGSATYPVVIQNCPIFGFDRAQIHSQNWSGGTAYDHYFRIVNCTLVGDDTAGQYGIGWRAGNAASTCNLVIKNVIIGNNDVDFGETSTGNGNVITTSSITNWDEDGTAPFGVGSMVLTDSKAPGSASLFSVHESISDDLSLVSNDDITSGDNDVLNTGTGPSTDSDVPTLDMLGITRSGTTCDPGAFQLEVAADPVISFRRRIMIV